MKLVFFLFLFLILHSAIVYGDNDEVLIPTSTLSPSFSVIEILFIETDKFYNNKIMHVLGTTELVIFNIKEAGWPIVEIMKRLEVSTRVFSQCGLKFTRFRVITVSSELGGLDHWVGDDVNMPLEYGSTNHIASLAPEIDKVIIYFVGRLAGSHRGTSRRGEYNSGRFDENTAWISYWNDLVFGSGDLLTTAHEIAHVLGNFGHTEMHEGNNLMGLGVLVSEYLSSEQCEKILDHPYVNKIH